MTMPYGPRQFRLDRMRELLARVGSPQQGLAIVHVAGTKGKGSTAAMIASVLTTAGYRTGLFTSPHLVNVEERIAVDGENCSPRELVELVERLRPIVEAMDAEAACRAGDCGPTYFELTTVMALLSFMRHHVQAAVLEVGMGGRLDSTNVCSPAVSVITSISLDHTRQLGNTLGAIACEKAGIVKAGVPVVSGVTDDEPRQVIEQVCRERGSRLIQLDRDFGYRYFPPLRVDHYPSAGKVDFHWQGAAERSYEAVSLGLLGAHQGANAAVALATLAELASRGWSLAEDDVRTGLAEVRSPARVEIVGRRPAVVIDAAHNVASIEALVDTLQASFSPGPRIALFAPSRDKDVRGMLSSLAPKFDTILLTRYQKNPRGVPIDELAALAAELSVDHCRCYPDPAAAWGAARQMLSPDHLLCVTGSFFIAAEMRQEIDRRPLAHATPAVQPA
ncbi:MAG: bifunctional folylpolyglutamate synthase/dihydrofolate synthase [Planctomycetia bacterium]|nr:bifunctional folylpolyglutamate synthase/dihydrofolate synthase [Planctomycetia bacterium]